MSGIFQGYTNSNGRVRASEVTEVPAGSANDRGMIVAGNRVIPYQIDAGQPRTLHDGIAFDNVTGMLLAATTPLGQTNISMGGLLVDSRGAVMLTDGAAQVIHQGVGLQNNGRLSIESEPIATFIAHLGNNVASTTGPGTFTRASDGLYLGADGNWRVAPANEPRFENGQLLMEPAATNVFLNSDAAVTQTIILPLGDHTLSVRGSGSVVSSNNGGTATGHGTAIDGSPVTIDVTIAGGILFTVSGSPDYVQVERGTVPTSPIITQGAAGQRAIDTLQWADSASFFNQAQGMAIMRFNPQFAKTDFPGVVEGLLTLDISRANLLYYDTAFRTRDGTNTAAVSTPNFVADDNIYLASLYGPAGPGTFQAGYKVNGGSWVWSVAIAYDGLFPASLGVLKLAEIIGYPTRFSSIELYNENRGTAWVEANYQ